MKFQQFTKYPLKSGHWKIFGWAPLHRNYFTPKFIVSNVGLILIATAFSEKNNMYEVIDYASGTLKMKQNVQASFAIGPALARIGTN